jgi:hypothetical protein
MKAVIARFVMAAASWLAGLANGGTAEACRYQEEVEYDVVNLPTPGGTISRGNSIR